MSNDSESMKKVDAYLTAYRHWRIDPQHVVEPSETTKILLSWCNNRNNLPPLLRAADTQ